MGNLSFAIANLLIGLLVVGVVVAAALVLRPAVASREEPLGFPWAVGLATGGLGYLVFLSLAVGLVGPRRATGLPFQWWLVPVLLLLAGAAAVFLARHRMEAFALPRPRFSWRLLPGLALMALVLGVNLYLCFAPYFRSDALLYHLTLPYLWAGGGLRATPAIEPSGYPLLLEMLYTIPVAQGLPYGARIVHAAFQLGVAGVIYGFLRERLTAAGALAFASAFFIFDSVNEVASWANTDLGRTFFLTAAAASLARYAENGRLQALVLGSAMAGLALATHYMCLLFGNLLLTGALGVVLLKSGAPVRRIARDLAIFWGLSLAILTPWLVKNLVHYGQPFFGLQGSNFRIPSEREIPFLLGNVFFLGFAIASIWTLQSRRSPRANQVLALYVLGYLVVGPFEMPPIQRFFFAVYSAGLMLVGRIAAPVFERWRWMEVALPTVLLVGAVWMVYDQWQNFVFFGPTEFLFRGAPPASGVTWHH